MNGILFLAAAFSIASAFPPNAPCETLTIPQRTYRQVTPAFLGGRSSVYLYVPDIETPMIGPRFKPFDVWVVEGVYARPFSQTTSRLGGDEFARIRTSPNIKAMAIRVEYDDPSNGARYTPRTMTIGKETFALEIQEVNTSLFGSDRVTVKICR